MMTLIEYARVNRRRSKHENPKKRDNSFKTNHQVCHQAFSILYALKNKALFRLTSLTSDQRGQYRNRCNVLINETNAVIDQHIRPFPLKNLITAAKNIQYLDVKIMYELFLKKYPQYQCVKYNFYRKYFNNYHDNKFGRPRVDVCSTCEEHEAKIKSLSLKNSKRVAVAEKIMPLETC